MIAKKMGMTIRGTSEAAMVLILRSLMIRLQRRRVYMEKARACRAIVEKYALSTEDVCIKLLTVAENDPALARLVRSKSSSQFKSFNPFIPIVPWLFPGTRKHAGKSRLQDLRTVCFNCRSMLHQMKGNRLKDLNNLRPIVEKHSPDFTRRP